VLLPNLMATVINNESISREGSIPYHNASPLLVQHRRKEGAGWTRTSVPSGVLPLSTFNISKRNSLVTHGPTSSYSLEANIHSPYLQTHLYLGGAMWQLHVLTCASFICWLSTSARLIRLAAPLLDPLSLRRQPEFLSILRVFLTASESGISYAAAF
jgi:hypothetical protein